MAIHRALAWVTHSREWMPASSQMAGRLEPPVLNWGTNRSGSNSDTWHPGTSHKHTAVLWALLPASHPQGHIPWDLSYLQDVHGPLLVGFPDLDLFHKAVLRGKVVQLFIDLK